MSRYLAGLAALALMGAATLPLQANAAERPGASNTSTTLSAQRWHPYYRHRYWGPRYYRYGYYGYPRYYRYGYYGYPYGYPYRYYRPGPFVSFGVGPFGFRFF